MSSFLKVQVALFLIYSNASPTTSISNILKSIPIFGWAVENNNDTFSATNATNRLDLKGTCIPPLLLNGLIDPLKREYKAKDVIQVTCKEGFALENHSSSVLFCSPQGLWEVFTFDNDGSIPLPRCIVIEKCPPLPPLIQGSMQVQEGRSNGSGKNAIPTMATYKCWSGYTLDPPESSIRRCTGGKWSGEDPKCVFASCTRPPKIVRGYVTSRGVVNHVYQPGSSVRYHCDSGYQLTGPSVLTCSGTEWIPKEVPSCSLLRQLNATSWPMMRGCLVPPPIANGQVEILPMKQQPRLGANSTWPTGIVPVYTSAVYSCRAGFAMRGPSLIFCTAHGWWQPPHSTPRCVLDDGPDPDTNAIQRPVNGGSRRGMIDGNGKLMIHPWMMDSEDDGGDYEHEDDGEIRRWTPVVSLSMAFGVVIVLGLVWIASRCNSISRATANLPETSCCLGGQRPIWWSRFVSPRRQASSVAEEERPSGRICGSYLNVHQQPRSIGAGDDADRLALIGCDQQMTLPSYEEAMGTSSTIHHDHDHHANRYVWPMAPPPYDAVVSSSSSSASSNPEPAAAAAAWAADAAATPIENPPTVIHHRQQPPCRSGQAQDEQARVAESGQPIVCIDHRDDSEAGGAADAPSGSRENLVP